MISKAILHHARHHGFGEGDLYGAYKIFFGTLVSESRLKIVNLLRNGRKNVSEVMSKLKASQTAVSHDLARLKKCGFVIPKRDGKFIYYRLNEQTIKPLMHLIDNHMSQYCMHIMRRMKNE